MSLETTKNCPLNNFTCYSYYTFYDLHVFRHRDDRYTNKDETPDNKYYARTRVETFIVLANLLISNTFNVRRSDGSEGVHDAFGRENRKRFYDKIFKNLCVQIVNVFYFVNRRCSSENPVHEARGGNIKTVITVGGRPTKRVE